MQKLIKTNKDHDAAINRLKSLMIENPAAGSKEFDEIELLTFLVKAYEDETVYIPAPTPIEAIRFHMEQSGMKQKDLISYIGTKSQVSEVLSGKRPLTLTMARRLHQELGIPATALLGEGRQDIPSEIDTSKYPVREMQKLGWFPRFPKNETWASVKIHAEEMLQEFFAPFKKQEFHAYNRAGFKADANLNDFALNAWRCKILQEAAKQKLPEYHRENISDAFIRSLTMLSQQSEGPRLAIDFLKDRGIAVVVCSHLPKTYLDGAAMKDFKGNPVIGLTLRHDRLDNFWFCLLHELGHVIHHLDSQDEPFFDDTESGYNSGKEREANRFALDHLIDPREWETLRHLTRTLQIRKEAKRLAIHPSIIAGRIRREASKYSLFPGLVGSKEVRRCLGYEANWPI